MSIRKPRISLVSWERSDVSQTRGHLAWIIDHDMIVGFALFSGGVCTIFAIIAILVG